MVPKTHPGVSSFNSRVYSWLTQDIFNRATNRQVTMETDAKKKRAMRFLSSSSLFNGHLHA